MFEYTIQPVRMTDSAMSFLVNPVDEDLDALHRTIPLTRLMLSEISGLTPDETLLYLRKQVVLLSEGFFEDWEAQRLVKANSILAVLKTRMGDVFPVVTEVESTEVIAERNADLVNVDDLEF